MMNLATESAIAAADEAGCIVAEIFADKPPEQIAAGDFDQCCAMAREAASVNRSRVFGVFKLSRDFRAREGGD